MSEKITRRDFLKLTAAGLGAGAVLTGCGPASRYVTREPYQQMPEYTYNGQSTFYATTCRECPAGCGIVVRTMQGRAIKIEGNRDHPVNLGKTCSRGQAAIQGLYNPDRVEGPVRAVEDRGMQSMTWEDAAAVIKEALTGSRPDEIAFLLGPSPDHLFDLVSKLTAALGAPAPLRYGASTLFEAPRALLQAAAEVLGAEGLPFFDLAGADLTFSFGANFLETYLSPVAYGRGFARMRRGRIGRRGRLIQFEPRLSQTAASADEWIPVAPGTEGLVAAALGRLAAEAGGAIPPGYLEVDVSAAAAASGVGEETLRRLAGLFREAERSLVVPGAAALAHTNGLEAARSILSLNVLAGNPGLEGGVFVNPGVKAAGDPPTSASPAELNDLIGRMGAGRVEALFVHGANPAFELPHALGFSEALESVPLVISFASFPDETAALADYVFPDHTPLESWGYQRVRTGADRPALSGSQPAVVPFHDTRATADILLAAAQASGGALAAALPYADEVDFIKQSLVDLVREPGVYEAPEINTFMTRFQQHGGWWSAAAGLGSPQASAAALGRPLHSAGPEFDGDGQFHLLPYPSPVLGDGAGANRPWLQETPDPMTTVMWNTWVEINPATAAELGLEDDDVVRVVSPFGALEAPVYRYPAIRPDTVAIPFGQGHTALGRYAQGRGANPARLLGLKLNGAGDLAFSSVKVRLEKTGRTYKLARLESRIGVYGDGLHD
jgi:anaerobic selenocysteine-containing dehydrogenase